MSARLSRRTLIAAAFAVTAAFAARREAVATTVAQAAGVASCAARFRAIVAPIGRVYLRSHPDEADGGVLTDLIVAHLDEQAGDVVQQLSAAVRDDFRLGRLVQVDNWFLSRTEARLCAVAYVETMHG